MPTPERIVIESMFKIVNKDREAVPFRLNVAQRILDDALTGRDIVPKARQEGVSSYVLARYCAICLTQENARCVVISHDIPSTQRMLKKVHYILENINGPPPRIKNASKNEIVFEKTGSMFYIGTAGSRIFGRGDTISHLHCSEYAYWPKPKELLTGLFQAVPASGEIIIESTGNGTGNDYYKRTMRAAAGQSRFTCHFLPWHIFPEYSVQLTAEQESAVLANLRDDLDEPRLVDEFNLTAGQIVWRRDKIEELDFDIAMFRQEYPMTLDECFQSSGHSIFSNINLINTDDWVREAPGTFALKGHPREGLTYVVGADPAGGSGRDQSSIEVLCVETDEQVFEFFSNTIPPDLFGHKVASVGRRFGMALLSIESNNHGIVTINEARKVYPQSLIYRAFKKPTTNPFDESLIGLGVSTNARSRPILIAELRSAISSGLKIYSTHLKGELDSFVETETGKLEADGDANDDCVIALAMANIAREKALLTSVKALSHNTVSKDPFVLGNIIKDLKDSRDGLPIGDQTW